MTMLSLKRLLPQLPVAFWGLVLAYVAVAINTTVASVALPPISRALVVSSEQLTWIVNCTPLAASAFMLFGGHWASLYGFRRVLVIGLSILMVSAVGASLVLDVNTLIAFRTFSGLGSALVMPSALVLAYQVVDESRRRTAIGLVTAAQAIGGLLGPLLAGYLITAVSWRAALLSVAPLLLVSILIVCSEIPKRAGPKGELLSFDQLGAALTALFGTSSLLFMVNLTNPSDNRFVFFSSIAVAVLSLVTLFIHEARCSNPLFQLKQLRKRSFLVPTSINWIVQLVYGGMIFLNMQYLQLVVGLSAFKAALLVVAATLVWILCSSFSGVLSKRIGSYRLAMLGLISASVGYWLIGFAGVTPNPIVLTVGFVLSGSAGIEPAVMVHGVLASYDEDQRSFGASLNAMVMRYGLSTGIALSGVVLSTNLSAMMTETLSRLGESVKINATGSIGGAFRVAESLPVNDRNTLIEAAKVAFVDGYRDFYILAIALYMVAFSILLMQSKGGRRWTSYIGRQLSNLSPFRN